MSKIKKNVFYAVIIFGGLGFAAFNFVRYADRFPEKNSQNVFNGPLLAAETPLDENRTPLGFNVSHTRVPKEDILMGGPPKDGIPAITNPKLLTIAEANFKEDRDPKNKNQFLKEEDLVIGVSFNNDAMAYPLRILDWHEIVNHTVGDQPVAITYCPLCRSALVFDSNIDGQVREFGVSGHLWNSNVLMYDRQNDPEQESLWSQIKMGAVAGVAAEKNLKLKLLPSTLATWKEWKALHPTTKTLSLDTGHKRPYLKKAYKGYFDHDRLMKPVKGQGERPERFQNKEPMILISVADQWKAYAVKDIAAAVNPKNYLEDKIAAETLRLNYTPETDTVQVEIMGKKEIDIPVAYLYWFSLNAILPDVAIYDPEQKEAS